MNHHAKPDYDCYQSKTGYWLGSSLGSYAHEPSERGFLRDTSFKKDGNIGARDF